MNRNPKVAEANFRARLAELGAILLETQYRGSKFAHKIECACGNISYSRPNDIQQGDGICRVCAKRDPKTAEANFRARLAELDAILLEPRWLGTHTPHKVQCAAGHICYPYPGNIRAGDGICRACSFVWDIFYIVATSNLTKIKFGITSHNPEPRLKDHRHDGFIRIIRLYENLPNNLAHKIEQKITRTLRDAGIKPIRGYEYYPGHVLARIVFIADSTPRT